VHQSLGVKFDPISIGGLGIEVFFFEWYRCMDVRINVICTDLILTKCLLLQSWAFRFYLIDILNFMRSV
jgi:hypothetical protein